MAWERKGECTHCGFCCRAISVAVVEAPTETDLDYFRARGYAQLPGGKSRAKVWLLLPCPSMDAQLDGTSRCGIYEVRPKTCREFPTHPTQVVGTPCTYWFENEGKRIGGMGSLYPTDL